MLGKVSPNSSCHGHSLVGILFLLVLSSKLVVLPVASQAITGGGTWQLLLQSAGISSMHSIVTRFNTIIMLDRTNIGATQINLANGKCRDSPVEQVLKHDCYAHSVVFDIDTNTVRPVELLTDTWCSSGGFFSNGTLIQTGGDFEGVRKIRRFEPCLASQTCDWVEYNNTQLQVGRWYSTNQLLPDNTMIIVGGRSVFNYEFLPQKPGVTTFDLPFLKQTQDPNGLDDNLYPFVHLLPNGLLYIFANRDSILLNYTNNTVLRTYPKLPGEPRNYPSAGSSVLLPLDGPGNGYSTAEVLVCGGSRYGAYQNYGAQFPASNTCGRMTVTSTNPQWVMETMPIRRNMGDMILLPTANVLLINGAQQGSQGWGAVYGNATLNPVAYLPTAASGSRFLTYNATTVARVYHATANLVPDGRIILAGSNSHQFYTYTGIYPTELKVEAFSPPYLHSQYTSRKPQWGAFPASVGYGQVFVITFSLATPPTTNVEVNFLSAPFTTHSYAQAQRLLKLVVGPPIATTTGQYSVSVTAPPHGAVAPPSYYMAFLNNNGIPSSGVWIHVGPITEAHDEPIHDM